MNFSFVTLENLPDDIPDFQRESTVAGWHYFIKDSPTAYLKKQTNMGSV
ncbi:hypothetical protein [Aureibaculum luteum]|nr:hypothetical protein [Aureibaculum luteum]